jgi:hypothetical protein
VLLCSGLHLRMGTVQDRAPWSSDLTSSGKPERSPGLAILYTEIILAQSRLLQTLRFGKTCCDTFQAHAGRVNRKEESLSHRYAVDSLEPTVLMSVNSWNRSLATPLYAIQPS